MWACHHPSQKSLWPCRFAHLQTFNLMSDFFGIEKDDETTGLRTFQTNFLVPNSFSPGENGKNRPHWPLLQGHRTGSMM